MEYFGGFGDRRRLFMGNYEGSSSPAQVNQKQTSEANAQQRSAQGLSRGS